MMRRPFVLSLLPERLRVSLYHRCYHPVAPHWTPLFDAAPLAYAPNITMTLVPTDVMHGCIALTGVYELGLTRRLSRLARAGGMLLDVGANAGYFSLLWAAARPDNRCIAFEASPRNAVMLSENVRRNCFQDRINVRAIAAGKSGGTYLFNAGPTGQTGWGAFATKEDRNAQPIPVVRIDETVDNASDIAVLKIDAEGADTWVLEGCELLLRAKRIRHIFYEQNRPRMRALGIGESEAGRFLASMGYDARPYGRSGRDVVDWVAES
ncbi:MAG: FkbM family methyltransferase [Fibrobacterota bacterium]